VESFERRWKMTVEMRKGAEKTEHVRLARLLRQKKIIVSNNSPAEKGGECSVDMRLISRQ
jgi:hypothetical protein